MHLKTAEVQRMATQRSGASERTAMLAVCVVITVTTSAIAVATQRGTPPQPVPRDAPAITAFVDRVNAYVALHQQLEKTTPKLPDAATPKQIDDRQRAL